MKLTYFLVALVLFSLVEVSYSQNVAGGLKIGVNLADLSGTVNEDTKVKPGMVLGGYLQVPLSNLTYYHPEIQFSSQGSIFEHYGPSTTLSYSSSRSRGSIYSSRAKSGETKVKLNYLNVLPLSLKIYFSESKDINLQIGPQFGFLLSAKEEGEENGDEIDEDLSDVMKVMDVSAVVGLGVDLPVGINFGARLNYGLTDISMLPKEYPGGFTRPKLTNVVFQFHLGYTFRNSN
jgi:hypothetical protein